MVVFSSIELSAELLVVELLVVELLIELLIRFPSLFRWELGCPSDSQRESVGTTERIGGLFAVAAITVAADMR
jgi:hypothetical protein